MLGEGGTLITLPRSFVENATLVTAVVGQDLWYPGRIQWMRVKKGNGWGSLKQPLQ